MYAVCVGSYRKVRRPCSCWRCGNPRKYFGAQTRQEIKAALSMRDQDYKAWWHKPPAGEVQAGSLRYH